MRRPFPLPALGRPDPPGDIRRHRLNGGVDLAAVALDAASPPGEVGIHFQLNLGAALRRLPQILQALLDEADVVVRHEEGQMRCLARLGHGAPRNIQHHRGVPRDLALKHPRRNQQRQLHQVPLALEKGDRLLLCSDGLGKVVSLEEVISLILGSTIKEGVSRLIDAAIKAGGPDNVTVVLAELIEGDGKRGQQIHFDNLPYRFETSS